MAETTVLVLDGEEEIVVPDDDVVFVVFDVLAEDLYSPFPSATLYPGVDIYPGTS